MTLAEIQIAMSNLDVEVRRDAVLAAGARREREMSGLLMQALGDPDWRVREEAIALVGDVAVEFELIGQLIAGLCQGANVGLRNAARDVLRRLGAVASRALVSALTQVEPNDRKFIVEALAAGGTDEAIDTLIESLRASDPVIAVAAMDALAQLGGARVEEALCEKLKYGDTFERAAALDALELLQATVRYEDIEPLLEDRLLRRIALDALGRSGDVRAVRHLLQAFTDRSAHVTRRALLGLFRLQAMNGEARELLSNDLVGRPAVVTQLQTWVRDEDRQLGLAAVTLLARAHDREAVQLAVELVARDVAAEQLGAAFDRWVEEALADVLRIATAQAGWRAAALELACELAAQLRELTGDTAELRLVLRDAFTDLDPRVRIAVLRGLGRFGQASDAALILGCTRDADADVAVAAGNALRELAFREPGAVRQVLSNATPAGPAGLAVAELLADLGARDAIDRLRQALWSDEPNTRVNAMAGLARLGGHEAAELAALALRDVSVEVQVAALDALAAMPERGPVGTQAILEFETPDPDVLCMLTRALGAVSDTSAVQRLREIAQAGPREARLVALRTLLAHGDAEAQNLLIRAVADSDPEVATEAISELGSASSEAATEHISAALAHPSADVRRLAASWLARIGPRGCTQTLTARLSVEDDATVRNVITEALAALRGVR